MEQLVIDRGVIAREKNMSYWLERRSVKFKEKIQITGGGGEAENNSTGKENKRMREILLFDTISSLIST